MIDGKEHWYDPTAMKRYTLHEIASIMRVTRERVRQIERSALKKAFAHFSSIARREGENPIEWFRVVFGELEQSRGGSGTFEYDCDA